MKPVKAALPVRQISNLPSSRFRNLWHRTPTTSHYQRFINDPRRTGLADFILRYKTKIKISHTVWRQRQKSRRELMIAKKADKFGGKKEHRVPPENSADIVSALRKELASEATSSGTVTSKASTQGTNRKKGESNSGQYPGKTTSCASQDRRVEEASENFQGHPP